MDSSGFSRLITPDSIISLYLSLIHIFWLLVGRHIKWKIVLPCVCALVIGLSGAGAYYHQQQYTVTYLPCGSGQAIIVSDADHVTLIDCAGDGGYRDAAALFQRIHSLTSAASVPFPSERFFIVRIFSPCLLYTA